MAKRKEYSSETRAAAISALMTGQGVTQVAKEYKIPVGTVKRWNSSVREQVQQATAQVRTEKKELLGTLIIDGLVQNLQAGKALAKHFENTVWLNQQSAEGLAVLYGVLSDKAVRLLEALGSSEDGPAPPGPGE